MQVSRFNVRALSQSLHVEIYVPHDLPAGTHRGTLTLHSGRESLRLRGRSDGLGLHAARSPQLPARDELLRPARKRARLLPAGPPAPDGAEPSSLQPERADAGRLRPAVGQQTAGLDWSSWDRRFGPLLDGSAFADLPRKGVPVECFYLPLHENWPSPMEGNYNGDYWADRAFPESYRRAFVAAARQIAAHFQAKRWTETLFQGFLNNKNNFKASGWSRGSSPWLLDEPANFQDYWALRYFARAFHEGINQALATGKAKPRLLKRQLPTPGLPRRYLAAAMAARQPRRPARLPRGRLAMRTVSAAGLRAQATASARSCSSTARPTRSRPRTFSRSAGAWTPGRWVPTVSLPWQTIGTAGSWKQGDELALFYPLPGRRPRRGPPDQNAEPQVPSLA